MLDSDVTSLVIATTLGVVLVQISINDIQTFRIPDPVCLSLMVAGLSLASVMSSQPLTVHLIGAFAGYSSLAMFGEIFYWLRGQEGLGLGDAKLFAAAGAWLGWPALPFVLLGASVMGLAAMLVLCAAGAPQRQIPFGPFLSIAFWVIYVAGAPGLPVTWL